MKIPILELRRLAEIREHCVLGHLLHNGIVVAHTLELPWRDNQPNASCIASGEYSVRRYRSQRFGVCFAFLDHETDPRTSIRIHAGNTARDTTGCVLVGRWFGMLHTRPAVCQSKIMLRHLLAAYQQGFTLRVYPPQPNIELDCLRRSD